MQTFTDGDFLLNTSTARALYHEHARLMPVADYHCHISPKDIYEDRRYDNLAEIWLAEDRYKWRALRACGVEERLVTGDAPAYEKFRAWAEVVPKLVGSPLYHWTHLELARYFGISETLSPKTCGAIWEQANEKLKSLSVKSILQTSGVKALCTTDDPADDLHWHKLLRGDAGFAIQVLPTFRPDGAMHLNRPGFAQYAARLGEASGMRIENLADMKEALLRRMKYFSQMGCLTADHDLDEIPFGRDEALSETALRAALSGKIADARGATAYKTELLFFLAQLYREHGLVMQLRVGAARDVNPVMHQKLGPDAGFDAVGGAPFTGEKLGRLLGALADENALPKTVLYSLNPADNVQIAPLAACFPGKVQQGSAWWYNDTRRGIEAQLATLAECAALPNSIGMTTDARSPLSYARHEYFRRVLCALLGRFVEEGEYPPDMEALGAMARDISYHNAVRYFGFHLD